jgi:hypothetical protein
MLSVFACLFVGHLYFKVVAAVPCAPLQASEAGQLDARLNQKIQHRLLSFEW